MTLILAQDWAEKFENCLRIFSDNQSVPVENFDLAFNRNRQKRVACLSFLPDEPERPTEKDV